MENSRTLKAGDKIAHCEEQDRKKRQAVKTSAVPLHKMDHFLKMTNNQPSLVTLVLALQNHSHQYFVPQKWPGLVRLYLSSVLISTTFNLKISHCPMT